MKIMSTDKSAMLKSSVYTLNELSFEETDMENVDKMTSRI